MSDITSNIESPYFRQLPIAAVVMYEALVSKFSHPWISGANAAKKTFSHGLTALLLIVSLGGFYQLGSLAVEAHAAKPAPTIASRSTIPVNQAAQAATSLARSAPTNLSIPSINLTTNVVGVGQASDGSIEVPGPEETGWYTLGPSPGEIGPAVIVGHVDYVTIGPAVFWNLKNMKPGDQIAITREDGRTVNFKVEKVESYQQDAFPTQAVYGNINYAGLRLVTCDGDFNYMSHHYSNDLVVYARAQL